MERAAYFAGLHPAHFVYCLTRHPLKKYIHMKLNWFTRKGLFYTPASLIGWLILAAAVAYAVYTFIDIDKHAHSVSDTLINFVFNLLIIGLVYTLVGYFTEKRPQADAKA